MYETDTIRDGACAALYNLCNMHYSMVHNQTNTNRNGDIHHVLTPTVLLDNGSMVHNEINRDGQLTGFAY